jgi:polysaccharide biosynthesis/export protein
MSLIPMVLFAQQQMPFDSKFLENLPEDVRDDITSELNNKKTQTNLEDLNVKRRPISALPLSANVIKSERYGIQFFNSVQTSFMPINDPNIDGNYILDFGDSLVVHYIGVINQSSNLQILRDGTINLPKIGPVSVAGLSLNKASSFIQEKIKASLTGVEGHVTLSNLRDIQVLITGESSYPGIYTLNGNSNFLHALHVSGGINDEGSFRSIEIKRNGKTIKYIDLYDLIIFGNGNISDRLQSGDSIFIPSAKILVRVGGGFNNEGIFELKENETFDDLFLFAGGFSRNFLGNQLVISRLDNGIYKTSVENITKLEGSIVKNNDIVFGELQQTGTVVITGMVQYPGRYTISDNDKLSDLIHRAGGYKDNAYEFGAQLYREKAKRLEEANNIKLYNDFIKYLVGGLSKGIGVNDSLPILLEELKNAEAIGRVTTEFNINKIKANPDLDTLLINGDVINIPKLDESLYFYGEIISSGATRYKPGESIKDFINSAGGLTKFADTNRVIIIDPDGKANIVALNALFNTNTQNIYPGSVIYVPRDLSKRDGIEFAGAIAPLVSSLALSLASLNAINQ